MTEFVLFADYKLGFRTSKKPPSADSAVFLFAQRSWQIRNVDHYGP